MKKLLWLALIVPILAYIPFLGLSREAVGLNGFIFGLFLFIGIGLGITFHVKTKLKSTAKLILVSVAGLAYVTIAMGITDIALLTTGQRPVFLQSSGEGFSDLATFASWAIVLIPIAYVVSSITIVTAYFLQRRRSSGASQGSR